VLKISSKSKGGQYPAAFELKAIKRVELAKGGTKALAAHFSDVPASLTSNQIRLGAFTFCATKAHPHCVPCHLET
jgi:hypothetical protein